MTRPRLLDLFCGAGGAAMGYWRAGFDVLGVDHVPQPRYPFPMVCADAMTWPLDGFDAVHASPPCQAYTPLRALHDAEHPDLYAATRDRLVGSGLPCWVIENVPGAPFRSGVTLCGSMFGLRVRRHRNFETSHLLLSDLVCDHRGQGQVLGVYGHGGGGRQTRGVKATHAESPAAMGVDWPMTQRELAQAVPPAYTEWVGRQLVADRNPGVRHVSPGPGSGS